MRACAITSRGDAYGSNLSPRGLGAAHSRQLRTLGSYHHEGRGSHRAQCCTPAPCCACESQMPSPYEREWKRFFIEAADENLASRDCLGHQGLAHNAEG